MQKKIIQLVMLLFAATTLALGQLQSPDRFLPHRLGETFTPHHLLVDYFEHVAANSPNVRLTRYGFTNEARPLLLAFVSSPENLARLEAIRENNLRRAGLLAGNPDQALDVAIVWLSYSVHGNEAAGSEASMGVIYDLANPANAQAQEWLKNTVVIIDPSINPDGYSRYTHWYRGVANLRPNPNPSVREHLEPWPGGRVNHYLFDLNRDWAWQTQVESQQRIKVYRQWLPHIHADLHEQYYDSPYYFAPAAQPYHKYITGWQAAFQVEIGKNHAKYFDRNGWMYFTREVFDLLYPSYGDTYPTFSGAIGMTYEQGGHSRAGRAIIAPNRDTLTLADRVAHHRTTSLSTVEIASLNLRRLIDNFGQFYQRAQNNPVGPYKTYIFKGNNPEGRLRALCALLDKNGIRYGKAQAASSVRGYDYQTGQLTTVSIGANDLLVSAYQPMSTLAQVLLDPSAEVVDSNTYDITSWSLAYAYGLETYATTQRINVQPGYDFGTYRSGLQAADQPYAYLATWNAMDNARFLSELLQEGILVRYATSAFTLEGKAYAPGTLVINRGDNRKHENFDAVVRMAAEDNRQPITAVRTGFAESGRDLGSDAMRIVEAPRIALLSGRQTASNDFGQVWYFFEQNLGYPIDIYDADNLDNVDLDDYNILIMPDGRYRLQESILEKVSSWINGGGRLIAIAGANAALEDKPGFALTPFATDEEKSSAQKQAEQAALDSRFDDYAGQTRRWLGFSLPGAIYKLDMDNSHPLAFGLPAYYFSLKTDSQHYQPLKNAWNVGRIGDNPLISGFVGTKAREQQKNTVVFAVQDKGRGSVVYLVDNPLFRGFWENGKFLFSNALFFR